MADGQMWRGCPKSVPSGVDFDVVEIVTRRKPLKDRRVTSRLRRDKTPRNLKRVLLRQPLDICRAHKLTHPLGEIQNSLGKLLELKKMFRI